MIAPVDQFKLDKPIRTYAHKHGWWVAATKYHGPAHIIGEHRMALCGVEYYSNFPARWRDLCGNCRRVALKIMREATP